MPGEIRERVLQSNTEDEKAYHITWKSYLAVQLMEFEYNAKHFSYHGKELEGVLERLTSLHKKGASIAELMQYGKAAYDWKQLTGEEVVNVDEGTIRE